MKRLTIFLATFFPVLLLGQNNISTLLLDPDDSTRSRTVPVKVYFDKNDKTPRPVVIFSHGLGGSREGNPYLGNHWSSNGYIAVFTQHIGSDESVWKDASPRDRFSALKEAAGVKQTIDRFKDIPFVIDQLEKWNKDEAHPLYSKMNLEHIGMSGHSYGAVTTLGLTGRKFVGRIDYHDDRIDAFLPMSPQAGKGESQDRFFGHLEVPILCMTGTEDGSPIDPSLSPSDRQKVYAALPPGDKYQLVLDGAQHHAFGEGRNRIKLRSQNPNHHPVILKISTKFWDAYLKNDLGAKQWLQSKIPREACNMAEGDKWEWK